MSIPCVWFMCVWRYAHRCSRSSLSTLLDRVSPVHCCWCQARRLESSSNPLPTVKWWNYRWPLRPISTWVLGVWMQVVRSAWQALCPQKPLRCLRTQTFWWVYQRHHNELWLKNKDRRKKHVCKSSVVLGDFMPNVKDHKCLCLHRREISEKVCICVCMYVKWTCQYEHLNNYYS